MGEFATLAERDWLILWRAARCSRIAYRQDDYVYVRYMVVDTTNDIQANAVRCHPTRTRGRPSRFEARRVRQSDGVNRVEIADIPERPARACSVRVMGYYYNLKRCLREQYR